MKKIIVDGKEYEVKDKSSYFDVSKIIETNGRIPYLVKVGHDVKELRRTVKNGENIEILYFDDEFVKQAYARTATFMMLKSINDVYGDKEAYLKFKIQNSYYFEVKGKTINEKDVKLIDEAFAKLVKDKIIIEKKEFAKRDALDIINENKMEDVRLLFKYSYKPTIKLRYIGDFVRYINGELLYHTGFIKYYKISQYKDGLIITLPVSNDEKQVEVKIPGDKEFDTLNDSTNWAEKLKINTVGKINENIANDNFNNLVIMAESYQEKQIGDIAEAVKKSGKKFVFIGGPSSSGKTSFSHRLAYHLIALDLKPHVIACDNFFKERVDTPRDENGDYDFECLDAMAVDLLCNTIQRLLNNEEVEMPTYNFVTGQKEYKGDTLKLNDNDVAIFEGIHCLNPAFVPTISQDEIFKVHVSALTEMCIDNINRIATSDPRLIRRLIRDIQTRKISAKDTLLRWDSVKKGEEKSVFPYQERADIYFNSALIYEFNVIKNLALAKLYQIADDEEVGMLARRLIKTLNFFLSATSTEAIPAYSIIREFLGNSIMGVV